MKKSNIILCILLGLLALIVGLGLALVVVLVMMKKEDQKQETVPTTTLETQIETTSETTEEIVDIVTEDELESVSPLEAQLAAIHAAIDQANQENQLKSGGLRVFIGDSRMVGLQRSAAYDTSRDVFICKGAQFYEYFRDEAVPQLKTLIDTEEVSEVYINMGVNDAANNCKGWTAYTVNNYVTDINQLVADYPSVRFYFVSVGLVDGVYHGTTLIQPAELNGYINQFNSVMHEYCLADYLPCSEYLQEQGRGTADGVHFGAETNQLIYEYMVGYTN